MWPISGPIDINGLPRTGTTALADMLSLDPQFRCLRGWEQAKPVPPPSADREADDPRRLAVRALCTRSVLAEHDGDAHLRGRRHDGGHRGPRDGLPRPADDRFRWLGYHAWWRSADLTDTYEYHRRVVKLLGSRRPPDLWLFKAPHHKFHLEALVAPTPRCGS